MENLTFGEQVKIISFEPLRHILSGHIFPGSFLNLLCQLFDRHPLAT